ncbi:MAG: hypothetical protein QW059_05860 [Nitrososphaerota archaeon]
MPINARLAVLVLSLIIATSTATLVYINIVAYPEGPSRSVCTPTRLGNYLFEAYIFPASPKVGEEFQITATIQGAETSPTPLNITMMLLRPGSLSVILGPDPAPLGIKTWNYKIPEAGLYDVYFIVTDPGGSRQIRGRIQILSENEASLYSIIRILSYASLWIGVPLLLAVIVFSKMGQGHE